MSQLSGRASPSEQLFKLSVGGTECMCQDRSVNAARGSLSAVDGGWMQGK